MSKRKRVLFVDDDFMTVQPAVEHLQIEGHKVDIADTVIDAVHYLTKYKYDLILLDVMLPPGEVFDLVDTADGRYTGLRLLEAVRTKKEFKRNKKSRIVLITNWRDQPQVDDRASEYNAGQLRKPITLRDVEQEL